jgi:hypothetical protein
VEHFHSAEGLRAAPGFGAKLNYGLGNLQLASPKMYIGSRLQQTNDKYQLYGKFDDGKEIQRLK